MVARGGSRMDWLMRLLPVVILPVAVTLNAWASVPDLGLPLFAATPLIVATFFSPRSGAVLAGFCLVVVCVLDVARGRSFVETTVDILVVGLVNAIGVWVAHLAQRREADLGVARRIAEFAQHAVLPRPPDQLGSLRCAARYRPALSEAQVGGDFYAVATASVGVRAMIGDVRGKGMEAVAAVALVVGAFREHAEEASSLAELGVLRVPVQEAYLPLGSGLADPRTAGPPQELPFLPGTALLLLTDGVTEARDAARRFFDPERGMRPMSAADPGRLADALVDRVNRWTGGARQDDMALLVLSHADASMGVRADSAAPTLS